MVFRWVWMLPAVGVTVDLVALELVRTLRLGTISIPWLCSAVGLAVVPVVFLIARLWWPDPRDEELNFHETLTQRSRILGQRIQGRPIRIYVCELVTQFGRREYLQDQTDLLISPIVASLPPAQLDYFVAQRIADTTYFRPSDWVKGTLVLTIFISLASMNIDATSISTTRWLSMCQLAPMLTAALFTLKGTRAFRRRVWPVQSNTLALFATGNIEAALATITALAGSSKLDKDYGVKEAKELRGAWDSGLRFDVMAADWYKQEQLREEFEARVRVLRATES